MKCNEKGWTYNEEKYYLENEKSKKIKAFANIQN